jgi:DNA-nicking Smr family endonuclease
MTNDQQRNEKDKKGNGKPVSQNDKLWEWVTRDVVPLDRSTALMMDTALPPLALPVSDKKDLPDFRWTPSLPPVPDSPSSPALQLDRRTEDRLRKGTMPIDATIDLHGLTRTQAHPALARFILSNYAMGRRCLLVITGKGRLAAPEPGVLRSSLPVWLSDPALSALILRITPAHRSHGGEGAFYVLLRRIKTI